MQAEAFSYALGYNEKDYTAIGTASILATPIATTADNKSKGLYNGNIASMTSKTPAITAQPILQQQYSYDQLNRITASNTPGAGNKYRTGYSYDANGNIKTLARYDASSTRFDTLVYNYETKTSGYLRTTNRLRWVDDDALLSGLQQTDVDDQSTDNYSYDAIGNLTKDNQEEIAKIEWTVAGKVRRVTRTAASTRPNLEFEYDASGNRIIKKVLKKNGEITSTYYLRDASGNVMSIYSYNANSDNDPALTEQYLYGSSRIGVYTPTANVLSKTRVIGRKSYELSDHLGNVRATLSDYKTLVKPQIVNSATDYYPFGMVARFAVTNNDYRYGFNGKEHEDETGWQDYGMRMYNPALARFFSIDPLFRKYPELTTYQFASNTPIQAIDLDGLEAFFIHGTTNTVIAGKKISPGTHYFDQSQQIVKELPILFGNKPETTNVGFIWSGDDTDEARKQGGVELAAYILKNRKPGEPITIVGHSHGGNVAIEAISILVKSGIDPKSINLVALNTPDRSDQTLPKESPTNSYSINATGDMVQELGSNGWDFTNGIYIDNPDKEIFYEDQNKGGGCDYSNHCPSDENFKAWLPKLKQAIKEMVAPKE
jgi:RHS repeat-associated protein